MPDFRLIPSVDELRQRAAVRALEARFGAEATVSALREAASAVRGAIAGGDAALTDEAAVAARIESAAAARLGDVFRPSLAPVSRQSRASACTSRRPRAPRSRSYSSDA